MTTSWTKRTVITILTWALTIPNTWASYTRTWTQVAQGWVKRIVP